MNEQEFKNLIMPLHGALYACALVILHDEEDAADCLQDAFTRLWANRNRLGGLENITAYALAITRNLALTMATRSRRNISYFGDDPPDVPDSRISPGDELEGKESLYSALKIMRSLPENQRIVVEMSALSGLSNSEISERTGLTNDNVRVLLSRGRKRIKQLFSINSK